MQNSLPSGSANTTHATSRWPMSTWRAPKGDQPLHLGRLVVRPQIEVDPVFDRLGLRDLEKQDVGVIAARLQPPLAVL